MIVIFEGADASGKDVVREAFERLTKYQHTCVTRFTFSQAVFARYFKRTQWTNRRKREQIIHEAQELVATFSPLVVYCHAVPRVLRYRYGARGEDYAAQPDSVVLHQYYVELFEHLRLGDHLYDVDTSACPDLEDLASGIAKRIRQIKGE